MLDTSFVRAAIRAHELGNASPYQLSYARLGNSGASFGIFQNDTHVNPAAREALCDILTTTGMDARCVSRITRLLSQACPKGSPLTVADAATVNAALDSAAGRARVDALDLAQLATVQARINDCIRAAQSAGRVITDTAQLYIALWVNMTGAPKALCSWIRGMTISGVAPPAGDVITVDDIRRYLLGTRYFSENPRNFKHLTSSVELAVEGGSGK